MKRADKFYLSPEWRALRKACLARDGYRCVICHISVAGKGQARVDHILPRKTHPHLELTLGNLRSLCAAHDNQGHREKGSGRTARDERMVIRGVDPRGFPLDPQHPWAKART